MMKDRHLSSQVADEVAAQCVGLQRGTLRPIHKPNWGIGTFIADDNHVYDSHGQYGPYGEASKAIAEAGHIREG